MISKLKYTMLAMMLAVFVAQPVLASTLNNDDMAFAFGDSPAVSSDLGEMALLSDQEMKDTEGDALPALIVWNGVRWVVTRYVCSRVAVSALRRGCSIHCSRASQARSLARQAYGRNNILRHGPNGHRRTPVHYSHYQAQRGFSGHAFYGRHW